jgi:lipopolysaccharide/colanic/teichoic acid biosynthesis glycosyltransferase
MKISNWCERYLSRFPSELIQVNEIIDGVFTYDEYSFKARIKRIIESSLSLLILIFTSPLILIASILIKIEDGGPIFYTQIRNGFEGKKFKIIKLRTMIIDAEKNGVQWAEKSDRRITKIGKILRKIRIDELPQLWLVLSGEMSLIGPRPERPQIDDFLRENIPNYDLRYSIKPGISGWAQVNFPYGASIEDASLKLSYDLYYIKNFSILLDFMIFFKTLKLVINGKGATPIQKNTK